MAADERRTDLDWLRIAAFASLILYHVGMFYVSWDWHVKSSRASDAIEPLMLLVNPWRLILLFIISGAATRFMADKMKPGRLFASRMGRLWPPLLLAVFVIVPPQAYYEVLDAMRLGQLSADPAWVENFYLRYVTASGNWCDAQGCLITPTYNHMWFVAYLILYTLALFPLLPLLRRAPRLDALLAGPLLLITPWLFLFVTRLTLMPLFGETHDFRIDGYLHVVYLVAFVFGFAIAKHTPFFEACLRMRWIALALALAAYALLMALYRGWLPFEPPGWSYPAVREAQAAGAIVACFGFGYKYLRGRDGPIRRYFTDAIFPFYIVHQTVIVMAGFYLDPLRLPLWLEASAVIGVTVFACWATYEIARRSRWLRPWFGLRSQTRPQQDKKLELARSEAT